jgi:FixJ family two-component response regulator
VSTVTTQAHVRAATPIVHIVDDDEPTRNATSRLLAAAGFETRTYANARNFLAAIKPDSAGCIVLDVRLPDQSGLDLQVVLTERDVMLPVVFMTGYAEVRDTVKAIQRGAVDFLAKPVSGQVLLAAVSRAVTQDAAARAARVQKRSQHLRYERLTPRERQVFLHLISGQLNKQVAADLDIAEGTVKLYRARIFEKLEVGSMAQMARLAADLGIEPPAMQ